MNTTTPRAAGRLAAGVALLLALAGCGMPMTPGSNTAPASAAGPQAAPPTGTTPSLPHPTYPTGSPGTPRGLLPDPAHVNGQDPDAVAQAALTLMYAMDTTFDTTPHDATVRAAPFLTAVYADTLKSHQPASAPGAQWQTWTAHHAYTTATVTPAQDPGRPADTDTTAYRQYTITTTAHGDDGYTDPTGPAGTAYVVLTRASSGPWQVSTVQIR
ncbi:hypothetical protein [Kitasatospora sp. NBC_01302]|uniref:hypothetical protein n=1 Tax=Kitasatospora sp. NBC_01302 TaxID=2903575 RepID=UPI002E123C16|nr:hypothetical protein OG294_40935 [Kitasatospora sp. NBC_01302]